MFENRKKKREFVEHIFDNIRYADSNGYNVCRIYITTTPEEHLKAGLKALNKKKYFWEMEGSDLRIQW